MLIASYDVVDVMGYRRDVAVRGLPPLVGITDPRKETNVSLNDTLVIMNLLADTFCRRAPLRSSSVRQPILSWWRRWRRRIR